MDKLLIGEPVFGRVGLRVPPVASAGCWGKARAGQREAQGESHGTQDMEAFGGPYWRSRERPGGSGLPWEGWEHCRVEVTQRVV